MELYRQLEQYKPCNEQETVDREIMLHLLETQPDIFCRENRTAHMTASSWILNREHTKVLMIYHNIYNSWAWTGGHADGDRDLLAVAKREALEETGVTDIRAVSDAVFSIEILTVDGHEKRGVYVPSHLHLNVTYLLETDEKEVLKVKPDENSGVKWFPLEEALAACTEPWMTERVYKKLNEKLKYILSGKRAEISDETMDTLGVLAQLELSGEQKAQAKKDMSEMLAGAEKLTRLDTEGIEPMTHVVPAVNVFREDVVENGDGRADVLLNVPEKKGDGIKVPRTIV